MIKQRIPNQYIYNIFLTLLVAVLFIWILYNLTPCNHYRLYLTDN